MGVGCEGVGSPECCTQHNTMQLNQGNMQGMLQSTLRELCQAGKPFSQHFDAGLILTPRLGVWNGGSLPCRTPPRKTERCFHQPRETPFQSSRVSVHSGGSAQVYASVIERASTSPSVSTSTGRDPCTFRTRSTTSFALPPRRTGFRASPRRVGKSGLRPCPRLPVLPGG